MRRVHFASGIEGLDLESIQADYHEVAHLLRSHGFEMTNQNIQEHYITEPHASTQRIKEMVEDDLQTLMQSDLLLVDRCRRFIT